MAIPRDKDARKYYRAAHQRLGEADLIFSRLNLSAAAVYIAGYAVECMLKSLILARVRNATQRQKMASALKNDQRFGHNIEGLCRAVKAYGESLPPAIANQFVIVQTWSVHMRYEPGPGNPTDARRFLAAAKSIVAWIDERMPSWP